MSANANSVDRTQSLKFGRPNAKLILDTNIFLSIVLSAHV